MQNKPIMPFPIQELGIQLRLFLRLLLPNLICLGWFRQWLKVQNLSLPQHFPFSYLRATKQDRLPTEGRLLTPRQSKRDASSEKNRKQTMKQIHTKMFAYSALYVWRKDSYNENPLWQFFKEMKNPTVTHWNNNNKFKLSSLQPQRLRRDLFVCSVQVLSGDRRVWDPSL